MKKISIHKGFTLVELLIVLAIIGTLTTFIMANFLNARLKARDAVRKSDLRQIQAALELYRGDLNTYPASLPACGGSLVNGSSVYLRKVPCDPTNSGQFTYRYTTTGTTYTLVACLENVYDQQKDASNSVTYCSGTTNWSYTILSP